MKKTRSLRFAWIPCLVLLATWPVACGTAGPPSDGPAENMLAEARSQTYAETLQGMTGGNRKQFLRGNISQSIMDIFAGQLEGQRTLLQEQAREQLAAMDRSQVDLDEYRTVLTPKKGLVENFRGKLTGEKATMAWLLWSPRRAASMYTTAMLSRTLPSFEYAVLAHVQQLTPLSWEVVDASPEAPVLAQRIGPDAWVCWLERVEGKPMYVPVKLRWLRKKSFPKRWPEKVD
jgi:hypothetical protein